MLLDRRQGRSTTAGRATIAASRLSGVKFSSRPSVPAIFSQWTRRVTVRRSARGNAPAEAEVARVDETAGLRAGFRCSTKRCRHHLENVYFELLDDGPRRGLRVGRRCVCSEPSGSAAAGGEEQEAFGLARHGGVVGAWSGVDIAGEPPRHRPEERVSDVANRRRRMRMWPWFDSLEELMKTIEYWFVDVASEPSARRVRRLVGVVD